MRILGCLALCLSSAQEILRTSSVNSSTFEHLSRRCSREVYVKILLEENAIAYTGPWLVWIGNRDVEMPEEL